MKKSICLLLLLPALLLFNSCKKDDLTASTDITDHSWHLERTKIDGNSTNTPNQDAQGNAIDENVAHRLIFVDNNSFSLTFTVNTGHGDYAIPSTGQISLTSFGTTEMCCDMDFDTDVIESIGRIDSYRVLDDELVLEGDGVEFWFLRE